MAIWAERYKGSAEKERAEFEQLALLMLEAQMKSRKAARSKAIDRALYARTIASATSALMTFADDLAAEYAVGFCRPGATYETIVRFSNASPRWMSDDARDMRGLAVRIIVSETERHDLLATNSPTSYARDARQFVRVAHALAGSGLSRIFGVARLILTLGPFETWRILAGIRRARRVCASVATETYWSAGALKWGSQAVRYAFRPVEGTPAGSDKFCGPARLAQEFRARLDEGDIRFDLYLQPFTDEKKTPVEDTAVAWSERVSPPVKVATLTIAQRDLTEVEAIGERRSIDETGFNPWNTTDDFRPLGHLNRARKVVYDASLHHRRLFRWHPERPPLRNRLLGGAARSLFRLVNRWLPWHRLPLLPSLLNLDALRFDLRRHNLLDTEVREAPSMARPVPSDPSENERSWRTYDGRHNDLSVPAMGAVGATFGRNMPPIRQELEDPNPVAVARALMDRHSFIPAKTFNLLAAAWIQFQVHDLVSHPRKKPGEADLVVPLPAGEPDWVSRPGGRPDRCMRISGNEPCGPGSEHEFMFRNTVSHWWDGSEVYGIDAAQAGRLRDGPRIRLDNDYLPLDVHGFEVTGFNESWWLGLSIMHTLFVREHNLICGELARAYPTWKDERVYQTARLIISALIVKIHVLEWTPTLLATEALDVGMKTNWYGPPSNWLTRLGIWLTDVHALKGIPETMPDHHGAPYSLTEEFTTVYRMHPLIPDDYCLRNFDTGASSTMDFMSMQGAQADEVMRSVGLRDAIYSFGVSSAGAITLHNFPRALQRFERDGEFIDLSVVDLVRTRNRGVPRYNQFRRNLRMQPITQWGDLTDNGETNRILREVYGDIEKVDTVVGLLGETPPTGFGFSETAFRIFILMASRRLQSDRFLTVDFRPEVYSPLGIDWITNNGMTSLIQRHCPELSSAIPHGGTAFSPWRAIN